VRVDGEVLFCINEGRGLIMPPALGGLMRKVGGSTEAAVNQWDPGDSRSRRNEGTYTIACATSLDKSEETKYLVPRICTPAAF